MSPDEKFQDMGGSSDGEFSLPSLTIEDFKELFTASSYVKASAGLGGGLLAWGTLTKDVAKTTLATVGVGLSSGVEKLFTANHSLLTGLGAFLQEYVGTLYTTPLEATFGTATAEFKSAIGEFGVVAWFLAVLEVIVILVVLASVKRRVLG
ncbi:hypothetical protein ELS19_17235 [Halogeometricum borinquense]|uniref:Uncharacterized protein n=1 Tax=Halogeometricum borinquense TaxID=60847 RepID=A0A482T8Q4_9EURY|nr:hypothetical protein [Halogeometricum borinquense]RYJ08299.1 hypothetical protein ELS19_17235 [Halogeometricum borinquense]